MEPHRFRPRGRRDERADTAGLRRLLGEIKERIHSAQYEALRKVKRESISLYWDIGRLIVERQ